MAQPGPEYPFCRRLIQGPSPSFIRELAASRYPLAMYEKGLEQGASAYGHGGYISIPELPAGVAVRSSCYPEIIDESAYVRILAPAGGWLSAGTLEELAACAEDYGRGLVHLTSGGTIEFYTTRAQMVATARKLNAAGLDVGSTGDDLRCLTACCGPARCEMALVDAPALATYLGQRFIDEQQYPGYPQKVKSGVSGCPNDCIRAMMQKDHSFIGVYRDVPRIDHETLTVWLQKGGDLDRLIAACPAGALSRSEAAAEGDAERGNLDGDRSFADGEVLAINATREKPGAAGRLQSFAMNSGRQAGGRKLPVETDVQAPPAPSLVIDAGKCRRCMACINLCPAIRPGRERGVAWVAGGKYGHRGAGGPMVGYVLVPFIPIKDGDYTAIGDLYGAFLEFWADNARKKERVGDFITRIGPRRVLEELGWKRSQ